MELAEVRALEREMVLAGQGALQVLALRKQGVKAAAVIPSYAPALLEGCGTIKKDALRVVGKRAMENRSGNSILSTNSSRRINRDGAPARRRC